MNARRRQNREGRGGTTRLNRWRRRLAESMPSPGLAQLGRVAKPRLCPTGGEYRRPERRSGGSALRDAGRPEERHNESPPPAGGGLEAGRGTRGVLLILLPGPNSFNASRQIVSNFIHPEAHNIPAQLDQALVAKLITTAQFPIPVAVIMLAIHFDIQLPVAAEQRHIQAILHHLILRLSAHPCSI